MKLYYVPRTRSMRPRWVLEELGLPYELVRLDPKKGETRTPEHLARQPLGHVPVLEDGDVRVFESMAICLYLAERYGEGRLLPPAGTAARAAVYQWLFFGVTEIEAPLNALAAATWGKAEAEWDRAAAAAASERVVRALAVVDAALPADGCLAGPELSVADVLVCALSSYALAAKVPVAGERLPGYLARLKARPAYRRATSD
jgi:glutathione S-transferase